MMQREKKVLRDDWEATLPPLLQVRGLHTHFATGAGIVRAVEADPDYRYRPEPEVTLDVLRKVVAGASPAGQG